MRPEIPAHVTMPLLSRITAASMDEDYEHVAARRALEGRPEPSTGPNRWTATLVVAVFGLMAMIAFAQTSREAAATEEGRQGLIRQIGIARESLAAKQATLASMREEQATLADRLEEVSEAERAAASELVDLRAFGGYLAVEGPGVRVRLDDSPDGSGDGVVRDEDLATLVAGLWEAGAEAIAINGQRLSSLTGIRTVNAAIHVRTRPLRPPYVVEAIGDNATMQAAFAESSSGSAFLGLRNAFGFDFEMRNVDDLELPGRSMPTLRAATVHAPAQENRGTTP